MRQNHSQMQTRCHSQNGRNEEQANGNTEDGAKKGLLIMKK